MHNSITRQTHRQGHVTTAEPRACQLLLRAADALLRYVETVAWHRRASTGRCLRPRWHPHSPAAPAHAIPMNGSLTNKHGYVRCRERPSGTQLPSRAQTEMMSSLTTCVHVGTGEGALWLRAGSMQADGVGRTRPKRIGTQPHHWETLEVPWCSIAKAP